MRYDQFGTEYLCPLQRGILRAKVSAKRGSTISVFKLARAQNHCGQPVDSQRHALIIHPVMVTISDNGD
jgi:hypothetical protein